MTRVPLKNLSLIFSVIIVSVTEGICPPKCICRRINQRDEIKVRCGEGKDVISNIKEIDLHNIANNIVQFNLSNNLLENFAPTLQLEALQKLDLSENKLTILQNNQFVLLPNLRRLDISKNSINSIEPLAFTNLTILERLKLNQNRISTIVLGTFNPLISLKQLDISSNPLTCDCSLLWLLEWSQRDSVKLISNPMCRSPASFKGRSLRKLKIGIDIHCKSPALNRGYPVVQMQPDKSQIVFEGDLLNFRCVAPSVSDLHDSKLQWTWLDLDAKLHFPSVIIETHFLQSTGLVESKLQISKLTRNHTGIWNCLLVTGQGNYSAGIMIVVISDDTEYCPVTVTINNKGTYTWPRTIVNYIATMPCESVNLNNDTTIQKAHYFCSEGGQWKNLNTSVCSYTSETTKIFEQFSKVTSNVIESAKHFRNYTSTLKHFKDVMDIAFAVETIENYLKYLSVNQIGGILMDVVNNILQLPKVYLRQANFHHLSCAKLVNITEQLVTVSSTSLPHKPNIAIGMFTIKKSSFTNLKCTWYQDDETNADHIFYCARGSQDNIKEFPGKTIEASVTIPETLFEELDDGNNAANKIYNMFISMYSGNQFFPIDAARQGKEDVTSAVVGAKLMNVSVVNLTDPVFVMLKRPQFTTSAPIPVWWDPRLNNGAGAWTSQGCHFDYEHQQHITFFCHSFGYYGLLQDVTVLQHRGVGTNFKFCHPAIYVGSFILFISLLILIVTYLLCFHSIQMPKKTKHCLINLWIAISLLCFLYVFGIYQTGNAEICQIVGMLLHYFTLSSLLWMCVGINCMYKALSKSDIMELPGDELSPDQPVKKPILGLYFVGWGVALIVCGISAAINIREYASPSYCFLKMGPPLSALYVPFTILLIFLGIFFLLTRCAINSLDTNGHLSEGTQATENVDLDLLEPNCSNLETRSVLSTSSKTASSEVEDQEHSPSAHLKAYLITLCLYMLCWLSCAFATVQPFGYLSYEEDILSVAYAVFCTLFSTFIIFFYCVARSDVRGQWILLNRFIRRKQLCFRTRNVSDAAQNVPHIQIQPFQTSAVDNVVVSGISVTSRSSSRSSNPKTNSRLSNALKSAADATGASYNESHSKFNNAQHYRRNMIPNIIENPTNADVFYNPHQSIVARKFFKRQKRHMLKRNNLVPHPRNCDSISVLSDMKKTKDNSSLDQSIFATSSKVNNANIHITYHVEQPYRTKQNNLNIFSVNANDYDSTDISVKNIALNSEHLRKKDVSKHGTRKKYNSCKTPVKDNDMRSVSQQCTLEYSSENISDSILDKNSPDKGSSICTFDGKDTLICEFKDAPVGQELDNFDRLSDANYETEFEYKEHADIKCDKSKNTPSIVNSQTRKNNGPFPRIIVNPSHDLHLRKGVQNRISSVSISDLDDLYQQIKRSSKDTTDGPSFVNNCSLIRSGQRFSDSDINSYRTDHIYKQEVYNSNANVSDNTETTV